MLASLKEYSIATADSSAPKYVRLRDAILSCLENGQLQPGDSLPAEQKFVEALGIARSTVRQALAILEHDGLLQRIHGRGTFVADGAGQNLRRGTDILALIVPEVGAGFYPALQSGYESAASLLGQQIIVANTDNQVERQANVILQLVDKNVAGLALVPASTEVTPASQVRVVQRQGIPVVFCHRRVPGVTAPLVAFNGVEVGRCAGAEMLARGHRHLAYFASHHFEMSAAYEEGLREVYPDLRNDRIFYGDWTRDIEGDYHQQREPLMHALREMFESEDSPTAIFASFDTQAELIYLQLNDMGLRVPEDVALIGFGGARRDRPFMRQLTSVVVDEAELGRRAVRMLGEMRDGKRSIDDDETVWMPLAISDGETLPDFKK